MTNAKGVEGHEHVSLRQVVACNSAVDAHASSANDTFSEQRPNVKNVRPFCYLLLRTPDSASTFQFFQLLSVSAFPQTQTIQPRNLLRIRFAFVIITVTVAATDCD